MLPHALPSRSCTTDLHNVSLLLCHSPFSLPSLPPTVDLIVLRNPSRSHYERPLRTATPPALLCCPLAVAAAEEEEEEEEEQKEEE